MTAKPTVLKLDSEVYGRFARASAIADYFEFLLWSTREDHLPFSKIEETLRDANVDVPESSFSEPSGGSGADSATRVFSIMSERSTVLADKYPFLVEADALGLRKVDDSHAPYFALLALTLAHAHEIQTEAAPAKIFERTVGRLWEGRGWLSYVFGRSRNFKETFPEAADALRLVPSLDDVLISRHSNDENVDTLSHYPWEDKRPGMQVVLSQATVGRSETWENKFAEPKVPTWRRLLPEINTPRVCLAVPHHVEKEHFRKLVQDSDGLLLDRLRIARFLPTASDEERKVIARVVKCVTEN